jgi:general nucleoside transport system ATP-binding protein
LDGVDLELRAGEMHALVGENGAGKSTLANIAFGGLAADGGTIERSGDVGLVHQHFELAERLRVWENILLGREPHSWWRIDRVGARARVRELAERHGLDVDPDAIVESLPVALRARVELLRELEREPSTLLLDEPTASLTQAEAERLFASMRSLAASGVAILIITHKLADVVRFTERVTVLRSGKVVGRFESARTPLGTVTRAMVGGELPSVAARGATELHPCLSVRNLSTPGERGALRDVSLDVRGGEIIGIAGIEGNGQTALADAIAGLLTHAGTIDLRVAPRIIPQDRTRDALVPGWSVAENIALGRQRSTFRRGFAFDRAAARSAAAAIAERFDVRPRSVDARVASLSGGNQQKVVVGRALDGDPKFVLAYQPTRGIDVGAAALVHSRLIEARNDGCAILLISYDLDEILALADRIAVLSDGRLSDIFERDAIDRVSLGALMAGTA